MINDIEPEEYVSVMAIITDPLNILNYSNISYGRIRIYFQNKQTIAKNKIIKINDIDIIIRPLLIPSKRIIIRVKEEYGNSAWYYTDVSNIEGNNRTAIPSENNVNTYKLPGNISPFQAEAETILKYPQIAKETYCNIKNSQSTLQIIIVKKR